MPCSPRRTAAAAWQSAIQRTDRTHGFTAKAADGAAVVAGVPDASFPLVAGVVEASFQPDKAYNNTMPGGPALTARKNAVNRYFSMFSRCSRTSRSRGW